MDTQSILEIVLKARDDASNTIKGVGKELGVAQKNVESLSKNFLIAGGLLTGMGTAGALVMNDWLKTAAAAENEMAIAQARLKNVADQVGKNVGSYSQLDTAIKKVSQSTIALGFDDETTYAAMVRNLGTTKSMKDAQMMLNAEMELARAKNIDVSEAATMLSRAYEMGGASLMRQGIAVDKNLKGMDLINAVYGKFKGTIENTNKTFEQSMKNLNLQFNEMKEKLGDRLLPTFTKFAQEAVKVLDGINQLDPKFYDLAVKVTALATGFGLVAGPILLLVGSLPTLAAGFGVLFGPLGVVLSVAVALGAAAYLIYTNWSKIQPMLQPVFDWLIGLFMQVKNEVMGFVTENIPLFNEAWTNLTVVLSAGLSFIQGIWNAVWPSIQQVFTSVWEAIKGALQINWGIIQVVLGVGLGIISGDWSKAWGMMKSGFVDIWEGMKNYLIGVVNVIGGIIEGAVNMWLGAINKVIDFVNSTTGSKFGKLGTIDIPDIGKSSYDYSNAQSSIYSGAQSTPFDYSAAKSYDYSKASSQATTNQNITINANMQSIADWNLLGAELAFSLRNNR